MDLKEQLHTMIVLMPPRTFPETIEQAAQSPSDMIF